MPANSLPDHLLPFPDDTLNRVCLSAMGGQIFAPLRSRNIQSVVPNDVEFLHGREATRPAGSTIFYMKTFFSWMRYTGCLRIATEPEINELFTSTIHVGDWIRVSSNLRDFFNCVGVDEDVVEHAIREAAEVAPRTPPEQEFPTNVPAPARRTRPSANVDVDAINRLIVDETGSQTATIRTGSRIPVAPRRGTSRSARDAAISGLTYGSFVTEQVAMPPEATAGVPVAAPSTAQPQRFFASTDEISYSDDESIQGN